MEHTPASRTHSPLPADAHGESAVDEIKKFYAPIANIIPSEDIEECSEAGFHLIARKWGVSLFDWAELGSRHKVRMPFTVADSLLQSCNMEIGVDARNLLDAAERLRALHVMLYIHGLHPFSIQLISSHSINQYAGINSRKGSYGRGLLPEGLRNGITSDTAQVEVWPAPYASAAALRSDRLTKHLTTDIFLRAVRDCIGWLQVRQRVKICHLLEQVLTSAPSMPQREQSLLHVWTGLESLFPKVQSEVSFRIALYLTQLQSPAEDRLTFFERAKASYNDRSRIAHGGELRARDGRDPWFEAWSLLLSSVRAIYSRQGLPSEEALIRELLGEPTPLHEQALIA